MRLPLPPQPIAKLAYSMPEAVEVTGISRSMLYEEIGAGRLIARKRGSSTIILATDLNDFLTALPVMAGA
jgi:hypothetical protein